MDMSASPAQPLARHCLLWDTSSGRPAGGAGRDPDLRQAMLCYGCTFSSCAHTCGPEQARSHGVRSTGKRKWQGGHSRFASLTGALRALGALVEPGVGVVLAAVHKDAGAPGLGVLGHAVEGDAARAVRVPVRGAGSCFALRVSGELWWWMNHAAYLAHACLPSPNGSAVSTAFAARSGGIAGLWYPWPTLSRTRSGGSVPLTRRTLGRPGTWCCSWHVPRWPGWCQPSWQRPGG